MTFNIRILKYLRRLFLIFVSLTMTWFGEKMFISTISIQYMVSCPTCSKNLGRYLPYTRLLILIYHHCYLIGLFRSEKFRPNQILCIALWKNTDSLKSLSEQRTSTKSFLKYEFLLPNLFGIFHFEMWNIFNSMWTYFSFWLHSKMVEI